MSQYILNRTAPHYDAAPCPATAAPSLVREGDTDYSTRWATIKRDVSSNGARTLHDAALSTSSRQKQRESTIWQRRFWEHQIREEDDFERHMDYVHFNPVKHGYVQQVMDWPHSTFHRYVQNGVYTKDWGGSVEIANMLIE